MYAITLRQPWADCIAHFGKRVENRTWKPPAHLLGERIAIHAGKRFDTVGHDWLLRNPDLVGPNAIMSYALCLVLAGKNRPRGAVVATAILADVVTEGDSPWFAGPYGWLLREVKTLETAVPCRGAQGLWKLPDDIAKAVEGVLFV